MALSSRAQFQPSTEHHMAYHGTVSEVIWSLRHKPQLELVPFPSDWRFGRGTTSISSVSWKDFASEERLELNVSYIRVTLQLA